MFEIYDPSAVKTDKVTARSCISCFLQNKKVGAHSDTSLELTDPDHVDVVYSSGRQIML